MTFRHEAAAALCAFALVLTACSGEDDSAASASVAARPDALVLLLDEADAAIASGSLADAGRILDKAHGLAPNDPDLWVAIARLRFRGGEHLTALEAVDRALALGPNYAPALLMRALMVRDAHGYRDAIRWFEAALAADSGNPDIWAEYAATLGDAGQASAMLEAVRKLAELKPDDPRVPFLQAVLAARGGEYTIARSLLTRSGMAVRGVPAAMQLDAVISLAEGNADSAAATLEALTARQPANARLRELLAKAMMVGGRADEVIARFAPEAARPETSPYVLMLVARAYEQVGDRQTAASLLTRSHAGAVTGLAVLAVRDGLPEPSAAARGAGMARNWGRARSDVQTLQRRFPASADVAVLGGDVALGAGDPQAALASYALATRVKRPWSLTRKAVRAYVRAGDAAAAATLLVRHAAGEPDNASALVDLAETLAGREDWARVGLLLDHAFALGAGHDPGVLGLRLRAARAVENTDDARRFAALLAEVQPRSLSTR